MPVTPRRELIGVLGGMGPAATIDFMAKIMRATAATCDQDHVPLIVHDVPQIPDRTTAIQNNADGPWLPLLAGLRILERAGARIIAIPCNTAHFWYERLLEVTDAEVLHIAEAVSWCIRTQPVRINRLAVMSTRGTILAKVYDQRMRGVVDEIMTPDAHIQCLIDRSIAAVKGGDSSLATKSAEDAARRLFEAGADHLLLACTELPIAMQQSPFIDRTIDATDALARRCVFASFKSGLPH